MRLCVLLLLLLVDATLPQSARDWQLPDEDADVPGQPDSRLHRRGHLADVGAADGSDGAEGGGGSSSSFLPPMQNCRNQTATARPVPSEQDALCVIKGLASADPISPFSTWERLGQMPHPSASTSTGKQSSLLPFFYSSSFLDAHKMFLSLSFALSVNQSSVSI